MRFKQVAVEKEISPRKRQLFSGPSSEDGSHGKSTRQKTDPDKEKQGALSLLSVMTDSHDELNAPIISEKEMTTLKNIKVLVLDFDKVISKKNTRPKEEKQVSPQKKKLLTLPEKDIRDMLSDFEFLNRFFREWNALGKPLAVATFNTENIVLTIWNRVWSGTSFLAGVWTPFKGDKGINRLIPPKFSMADKNDLLVSIADAFQCDPSQLLFFDDDSATVAKAREIKVKAFAVPKGGFTEELWHHAMAIFSAESTG